jgi:hypothetical protein
MNPPTKDQIQKLVERVKSNVPSLDSRSADQTTPVIQNGRVTLHWNAYPDAPLYSLTIYDLYWVDVFFTSTNNTSATTENSLPPAKYYYLLAVDFVGGRCVQALGQFSVP